MSLRAPLDLAGDLARAIAWHHKLEGVEIRPKPWNPVLWDTLRRWADMVGSGQGDVEWLERALASHSLKAGETQDSAKNKAILLCNSVVYCHNDLLSGNLLLVTIPGALPRLQLIDYEYAAPNFLAYDIANFFCEHCGFLPFDFDETFPSEEKQRYFLNACALVFFIPLCKS